MTTTTAWKRQTLLAVFAVAFNVPGAGQVVDTLDLTAPGTVGLPLPERFNGELDTYSHAIRHKPPLQVTLEAMANQAYRMGDETTYTVTIRNVGNERFTIPWEPDWTRIIDDPSHPIISCRVYLEINKPGGSGRGLLGGESFYGSSSSPLTLKVLAPGQSVQILHPLTWRMGNDIADDEFSATLPRVVHMRALLVFTRQPVPGRRYSDVFSINRRSVWMEPQMP